MNTVHIWLSDIKLHHMGILTVILIAVRVLVSQLFNSGELKSVSSIDY